MEYTLLKNIAVITMGQSPSSSSYNEEGVGIPFYQGNADFGELYPTARIWCDEPKKIANKNDILISVRAPIGALNYATEQCCIGRGLASITVKDEALRNYVFHLLKANRNKLINQGSGSTFKAIGKSNLEEIRIPIVDEMTQKKIMNLMDATEQTIRQRQIELQLFDDLIKARFVEMFGDVKTNSKGLKTLRGSDLFKFSSGKFLPEEKRLNRGIPVYGGNGIVWYTEKEMIDYPTIIIGRVGAQCGNIHLVNEPVWITDNAIFIKEQKTDSFALEFLSEMMTVMDFAQYADFSGQPKITQKPLESAEYLIPTKAEQMQYSAFCKQVDKSKVVA